MCVLGLGIHAMLVLALLASPDKEDRKFGIDKILKLRNGKEIVDSNVDIEKHPR